MMLEAPKARGLSVAHEGTRCGRRGSVRRSLDCCRARVWELLALRDLLQLRPHYGRQKRHEESCISVMAHSSGPRVPVPLTVDRCDRWDKVRGSLHSCRGPACDSMTSAQAWTMVSTVLLSLGTRLDKVGVGDVSWA